MRIYRSLKCPLCSSKMRANKELIGMSYICQRYVSGCPGKIMADFHGNPVKDDEASRNIRVKAQMAMEEIWRNNLLTPAQGKELLNNMCKRLKIDKEQFNIDQFSLTRCRNVIKFINKEMKKHGRKIKNRF